MLSKKPEERPSAAELLAKDWFNEKSPEKSLTDDDLEYYKKMAESWSKRYLELKETKASDYKADLVFRSMKSSPGVDGDQDKLSILTFDKEFDESLRNKDILNLQTVSAESTINVLRSFAEDQGTVYCY